MSHDPRTSTLVPTNAPVHPGAGATITIETPSRGTTSRHRNSTVVIGRTHGQEATTTPLRFAMVEELGHGGMGVVMRARDPDLHREVAVKLLRHHSDPVRQARFLAEAQITGQLEHPNIVPIHEFGRDADGRPWFAMKLVGGRDLAEILALRKEDQGLAKDWPLGRLVEVLIQVCNAVAFAHSRGVIHRDLKPANVMIGGFGEVLVMDWGLGKVLDGSVTEVAMAPESGQQSPLVTLDGAVIGTPCYMAPEQARGELDRLGIRSDVYALGAILSEMLTGRPPVQGATAEEVVVRAGRGQIDPPLADWTGRPTPKELVAVTRRAMALEPDQRYPSAEALALDLRRWREDRGVSAMDMSVLDVLGKFISRHRVTAAASGVLSVFIVTGMIVGYLIKEDQRRQAVAALAQAEAQRTRAEEALRTADEQRRLTENGRRREQALVVRSERQGHRLERSLYLAALGQADAALARGRNGECLRLMDQVAREERDWCWQHLRATAAGSGSISLHVADGQFIGPAGDGFVGLERSGRLHWWSPQGNERLVQPLGRGVVCAQTDADGQILALSLAGGGLRLIDATTGRSLAQQIGSESAKALAVAGEGRLVLTALAGSIRWSVLGGSPGTAGEKPVAGCTALAVAHDTNWWAAAGPAGGVLVQLADGADRRLETPSPATGLCASRDGRTLAAICSRMIRTWAMPAGTLLSDLPTGDRTTAVALHRSGGLLASGDAMGQVQIWDLETGLIGLRLPGSATAVIGLAWSANGHDLAVLRSDGELTFQGN